MRADPEDRVTQAARAAPGVPVVPMGDPEDPVAQEVPEEDRVAQVEDPVGAQVAQEVPGDRAVPEVPEEDRVVPAGTGDSSVSVGKL